MDVTNHSRLTTLLIPLTVDIDAGARPRFLTIRPGETRKDVPHFDPENPVVKAWVKARQISMDGEMPEKPETKQQRDARRKAEDEDRAQASLPARPQKPGKAGDTQNNGQQ